MSPNATALQVRRPRALTDFGGEFWQLDEPVAQLASLGYLRRAGDAAVTMLDPALAKVGCCTRAEEALAAASLDAQVAALPKLYPGVRGP